jgi:20S proteasome alpha/beta subunit
VTIGIAALCTLGPEAGNNDSAIIMAADRMLTRMSNLREYELTGQSKLFRLTTHIGVLVSGDGERFLEICRRTQTLITASTAVAEVARIFADQFRDHCNDYNERRALAPYGLDFNSFYARQRELDPDFVARLLGALADPNYYVGAALIAGVDDTGGHIHYVTDPGLETICDQAGYAAIGSGAPFAEPIFEGEGYTSHFDWSASLMITHAARRDAEKAAGVGEAIDMWVISRGTGIQPLAPESTVVKNLDQIYNRRMKRERAAFHRDHAALTKVWEALTDARRKAQAESAGGTPTDETRDGGGSSQGEPETP